MMVNNIRRRRGWFTENASLSQLANLALAGAEFGLKRETMRAWPVLVKVDISPVCNLRCTFCVHARPSHEGETILRAQSFSNSQRMSPGDFERLVGEIRGRSLAVSLYYLGDPLVHPDLDAICGTARAAGLNVHLSSNFSFHLTDQRLRSLVTSGLTHLTVCVDGTRQESYGRTRVGGHIDLVLANLERLLSIRRELGAHYPRVEVQFITFQHNLNEVEEAAAWCRARGIDQFTTFWGNLHNYQDIAPGTYHVFGPKKSRRLPLCTWPHFALQVKYNGDVIPCCYHRVTEQYRPGADARIVGNVFDAGVQGVWNSPAYQSLRRLVAQPTRIETEPTLVESFCAECPTIFETDIASHIKTADKHRWEDLYVMDSRQHVIRR
jgi:MoaA/NifB/PqqE/SkfB family radical SAM enzyme